MAELDGYRLSVTFCSNERPWSTLYDPSPYPPKSDEDAIRWARGMRDGLSGYVVTLIKDGEPIDIDGDDSDD